MSEQTAPGPVVVAWAPDEHGAAALSWGIAEARDRARPIVVVNASRGDAYVDDRYAFGEQLAELEGRLADSGLAHEVRQAVVPDVADHVVAVADQLGAVLVVVGLRRRTPVGKLIMGSVAQRILLDAHCPVLAVKSGTAPA